VIFYIYHHVEIVFEEGIPKVIVSKIENTLKKLDSGSLFFIYCYNILKVSNKVK
jgi:hypothetical protein